MGLPERGAWCEAPALRRMPLEAEAGARCEWSTTRRWSCWTTAGRGDPQGWDGALGLDEEPGKDEGL